MAFTNLYLDTLQSTYADSATTLTVGDASSLTAPLYLTIFDRRYGNAGNAYNSGRAEIVECTAISGNDLTVTRAQGGTTAIAFDGTGDWSVIASATAEDLNNKQDVLSEGAFVDGDKTKLDGIESSADVTDAENVGSAIDTSTEKTTPADTDKFSLFDTALKWVSWSNIKSALSNVFATLSGGNEFSGDQILNNNFSVRVFAFDRDTSDADSAIGAVEGRWNGSVVTSISSRTGDDTVNKDEGEIAFFLRNNGSLAERIRFKKEGNIHATGISFDGGTNVLDNSNIARTDAPNTFSGENLFVNLVQASLDLDSYNDLAIKPLVNFTRNSTKKYFDSQGVLQTASVDSLPPSYEYDGSNWVRKGWLIEEGRTNLFLNSETLSTQGVTVTAQEYTVSFYGTGSITFSGAYTGTLSGTGVNDLVSVTFTPSVGTVTCTVSGTVDYGQFEAGSFATSRIITAGSTVTRTADIADITDLSWYNQDEGTIYAEFYPEAELGFNNRLWSLDDNTTSNRLHVDMSSSSIRLFNSTGQDEETSWTPNENQLYKLACYYNSIGTGMCLNGGTVDENTGGHDGSLFTHFQIGNLAGSFQYNGYIKSIKYYPKRLSNDKLQALTS